VWDTETITDQDRNNCCAPRSTKSLSAYTATPPTRRVELVVRWKGGAISALTEPINRTPINPQRTEEDTVDLMRGLAIHYSDVPPRPSSTGKAAAPPVDYVYRQ
jgi:hypothetical protein